MSDPVVVDRVKEFLVPALEETFTKVSGIFLDRGTSLLETLAGVTAEEASRAPAPGQATLAAQVEHVAFYMDVLERAWNGEEVGKVDWKEIWYRRRGVSPAAATPRPDMPERIVALPAVPPPVEAVPTQLAPEPVGMTMSGQPDPVATPDTVPPPVAATDSAPERRRKTGARE